LIQINPTTHIPIVATRLSERYWNESDSAKGPPAARINSSFSANGPTMERLRQGGTPSWQRTVSRGSRANSGPVMHRRIGMTKGLNLPRNGLALSDKAGCLPDRRQWIRLWIGTKLRSA